MPFLADLITKEEDKALGRGGGGAAHRRPALSDAAGRSRRPRRRHAQGLCRYLRRPEFLAEAEKRGLGVNAPRDGKALQDLLERIYKATAAGADRAAAEDAVRQVTANNKLE